MKRSPYPFADRELLARIGRSAGSKAGYKQLTRELGLGGGRERRLLVEQLTRMVARGELRRLEDGLWALPQAPAASSSPGAVRGGRETAGRNSFPGETHAARGGRDRLRSGRLEMHRDGFGFVRRDARPDLRPEARPENGAPGTQKDIFIPPNALGGAMHGDQVLVDVDEPGRDGRLAGRIARILTRRSPTMVGIFHEARGRRRRARGDAAEIDGDFVLPFDERMGGPIEIPEGAPGQAGRLVAASAHRTLGEEAWRQRVDGDSAEDSSLEGMAVEVEITAFPQAGRPARGRIVEVLGPPDAFGVDVEILIRKHGIPHTFPAEVLAEAEAAAQKTVATLPAEERAAREDFRELMVVTIDGETAKDFDDAVYLQPLANGHTELQVHIADVSWYVRPGSALDTEARVRGTSVYFPDRAVPMLPHALSSGLCSLLPQQDRLVLSCVMEIDARGEIVRYRVAEGLIHSARRMTYTSVQHCLNASPRAAVWNQHTAVTPAATGNDLAERDRVGAEQPGLPEAVDRMLDLALQLNRKRVRRGSIDFDLPEPVVQFDPEGNMRAIVRSERGWAHRLIEEFMLSANECVATWLTAQGIASLYRIHEMPDPKRVMDFEETAAGFGHTLGVGALPIKRLSSRGDRRDAQRRGARGGAGGRQAPARELPDRIPVTPQMYQRLVGRIAGTPEERILSSLMLRSLRQARYSAKNEGHFALASPCYTHFTSPIRRYPDLIVHRLVRAMLRRGAPAEGGAVLSTDPQPWAAPQPKGPSVRKEPRPGPDVKPGLVAEPEPAPGLLRLRPGGEHSVEIAGERAAGHTPVSGTSPYIRRERGTRSGRVGWGGDNSTLHPESAFRAVPKLDEDGNAGNADNFGVSGDPGNALGDAASRPAGLARGSDGVAAPLGEPLAAEELDDIAVESSQAERRAADAERELIEWKKMRFMADKVGEDFRAMILSVTKFGFFVELNDLFVEGLVPLGSIPGDFYSFRDADRTICGARGGHCFRVGDQVEVLLDRIDRQERRLQFALLPGTEPTAAGSDGKPQSLRKPKGSRTPKVGGRKAQTKRRKH